MNSAVVKLSKLTDATTVWRGVSGGLLPEELRTADTYGVKAAVEPGDVVHKGDSRMCPAEPHPHGTDSTPPCTLN
jgi:hypothetical protein